MTKPDGRIQKGERRSPATEFKPGQHWREHKPFREKEWLEEHYVRKQMSAGDIAAMFGVKDASILFWLRKHGIPRRTVSEARAVKHWGAVGEANPMYGKRCELNANWQGGLTPARQAIYAKSEMRQAMYEVYRRDQCCRLCGSKERMEIHHIDPFSQSPLLVMYVGNMIVLCYECHKKMRGKEKRWMKRLFALVNEKGG